MKIAQLSLSLTLLFGVISSNAAVVLDPRDLDTRTAACQDFNQYANGGWMRNTPVPPGLDRIDSFVELDQVLRAQRLALIETLSVAGSDPLDALLSSLIRAALDESSLPAARSSVLQPLLDPIASLQKPSDIAPLIEQYQLRALPLLWRFDVHADDRGEGVLTITPRGTGLADPAFYLNQEAASLDLLGRYRGYAQTVLAAAGSGDVSTDSAWLLDAEARFARVLAMPSTPLELSLRELGKRFPEFDWKHLLKELGVRNPGRIRVTHPDYLAEVSRQLKSGPLPMWRAWLRFHVTHALSPWLDADLAQAHDAYFRGVLRGDTRERVRAEQALAMIELALPEAWSMRYADRYASGDARAAVESLFVTLRQQALSQLGHATAWDESRLSKAREKLGTIKLRWLQPEPRPTLEGLRIEGPYAAQMLALASYRQTERLRAIGGPLPQPVVRAQQPTLRYVAERNEIEISPALVQLPLFAGHDDPAIGYGALGTLLARELLQSLTSSSAEFDADGKTSDGWSESERAAWAQRLKQLADHAVMRRAAIDAATAQAHAHDLALQLDALRLAYAAMWSDSRSKRATASPGPGTSQRFFLAYARLSREGQLADLPPDSGRMSATLRINGLAPHVSGFSKAFGCKVGNALMLGDAERISTWP